MNKKLLVLLWVYASWVAAALLYNKKNPKEIESEIVKAKKSWDDSIKVLFNNFIEIHKNLFNSLFSTENKALLLKKKEELLQLAEDYKEKAEDIFEEYKGKWKDYAEEWIEKLEKFYNQKLEDLEELKDTAPEKVEQTKKKLIAYIDDLKSKLKK